MDFLDQCDLLLKTAWKPFVAAIFMVAGAVWYAAIKLYDREISTLKSERDAARELSKASGRSSVSEDLSSQDRTKLEVVSGRHFRNERVLLDGSHFERCEFINVTLVYNGGRFTLTHNNLRGFEVTSDNPEILNSWKFLFDFGYIRFNGRNEFGPIVPTNPVPHIEERPPQTD